MFKVLSILGGAVLVLFGIVVFAFLSGYSAGSADMEARYADATGRRLGSDKGTDIL